VTRVGQEADRCPKRTSCTPSSISPKARPTTPSCRCAARSTGARLGPGALPARVRLLMQTTASRRAQKCCEPSSSTPSSSKPAPLTKPRAARRADLASKKRARRCCPATDDREIRIALAAEPGVSSKPEEARKSWTRSRRSARREVNFAIRPHRHAPRANTRPRAKDCWRNSSRSPTTGDPRVAAGHGAGARKVDESARRSKCWRARTRTTRICSVCSASR